MKRVKTAVMITLATGLGLLGAVTATGTAQANASGTADAQALTPMVIKNVQTGRCLSSNSAGTVHSNPCSGSANQLWDRSLNPDTKLSTLKNRATGLYLRSNANGGVSTGPGSSSSYLRWHIGHTDVYPDTWRFRNKGNNECLENYPDGSQSTYTDECSVTSFQQWRIN